MKGGASLLPVMFISSKMEQSASSSEVTFFSEPRVF